MSELFAWTLCLVAAFVIGAVASLLWHWIEHSGLLCRLIDHKWTRDPFPISIFGRVGEHGEQDRCVRCGVRGRCYTGDKVSSFALIQRNHDAAAANYWKRRMARDAERAMLRETAAA